MKKIIALILAVVMVAALFSGCSKEEPAPAPTPTPAAEPSPPAEVKAPSEAGYWTLLRVDADTPENSLKPEDMELLKELGMEIFLDLKEDGTGIIMIEEAAALKWADGKFTLEAEELEMTYKLVGEELHMGLDGDNYVFVRGEGKAPAVSVSEPADEPEEESPLSCWAMLFS